MSKKSETKKLVDSSEELKQANDNSSGSKEECVFDNLKYLCDSTDLIIQSLRKGLDVAQMKDGDIVITEVKIVNTVYSWDKNKNKLVRTSNS